MSIKERELRWLCCVVLCCVVLSKVSAVRVRAGCWADGLHTHTHTHTHPSQFLPPETGTIRLSPSSPHASPLLCLRRGLRTVQAGQGASEPASSTLESTSVAASEISFSDKSPRAQANAQHQRPLFGPSFEGEARGDREPAAPMRAVEEVEFRPADGPGQDSAGALDCGHILGGLPDDQVHGSGQ